MRNTNALVLIDAERHRFEIECQRRENERRDRATPEVLALVVMGYVEGRHLYAERLGSTLGSGDHLVRTLVAEVSHPSYTELRNFLVGELDARYVDACRAAFTAVAFQKGFRWLREVRDVWDGGRRAERGWL